MTDVVEVEFNADKSVVSVIPVEYKSGEPKVHNADKVQLCAQALCLEEMFHTSIPMGYLYYFKRKHRYPIPLDAELRELTQQTIVELREVLERRITPPPRLSPDCKSCSLIDDCMPALCSSHGGKIHEQINDLFDSALSTIITEEEL